MTDKTDKTGMNLKIGRVRFHRNGVCGEGFFAVALSFQEDGKDHSGIMVVFPDYDDHGNFAKSNPKKYALTTGDVTQCWRGDRFIEEAWKAVLRADKNKEAYSR